MLLPSTLCMMYLFIFLLVGLGRKFLYTGRCYRDASEQCSKIGVSYPHFRLKVAVFKLNAFELYVSISVLELPRTAQSVRTA